MRICEIHIEEFGGLLNKSVTLDGGFNLLCGANESGKTTLCNFIKYIFYGFSGSERTKNSNFKTGVSSGYIIIEDGNGMKYRVARRDSERSKGRINVYKEPDGSEFTLWKDYATTPGEYFFGVSEKLYTRSLYISQKSGAALDGGSAEAVSNLLISGDEATNLNKARISLEGFRKSLHLKRGKGGKISDTEDRLSLLKENFEKGAKTKDALAEINASIKRLEAEKQELTDNLQAARDALANAKSLKIASLLKAQDNLLSQRKEIKAREEKLTEENTVNGFLPDEGYIRELTYAENAAVTEKKNHESLKAKITEITDQKKITVPKGYMEYAEMGGKAVLRERYKKQSSSKRTLQLFAIFCGILSVTSISSFFIPDSFQITLERSITFAAASTVAAILFGIMCIRKTLKLHKINKKLCITSKRPFNKAFEEFDAYEKSLGNDFNTLHDAISDSEKSVTEKQTTLKELLKRWGKTSASEAEHAFLRYLDEKKDIDDALSELSHKEHYNTAQLSIYTGDEIETAKNCASELSETKPEQFSERSITELEIKIENVKGELQELEIRRAEISGGGLPELDKLSLEIDKTESLLEELNFKYEAVELALSALDAAENGIRHTVSPYLSETAGELFTALTKKRHSGLTLDENMTLKYKDGETGAPIDSIYLSGGSTDLAWICLRLALHKKLSEGRPVPIILDECFVYFDDVRLKAILKRLTDMSVKNGVQILLFSASGREKEILQKTVNTVKI